MNNLPDDQQAPTPTATPSGNKEVVGAVEVQDGLRDATGQEADLPKEVISAGVQVKPTSIPIPAPVAQMGVKPAGNNVPTQTTTKVSLPLTQDQIAKGLRESIVNSIRWLAEWCVKRMKQLHRIRVKI